LRKVRLSSRLCSELCKEPDHFRAKALDLHCVGGVAVGDAGCQVCYGHQTYSFSHMINKAPQTCTAERTVARYLRRVADTTSRHSLRPPRECAAPQVRTHLRGRQQTEGGPSGENRPSAGAGHGRDQARPQRSDILSRTVDPHVSPRCGSKSVSAAINVAGNWWNIVARKAVNEQK